MKHLSVMIKPASVMCNMRCVYCFYADVSQRRAVKNYGMMSQETARRIVNNMLADLETGDTAVLAFQGGEPMLAGLDFFQELFAYAANAAMERGVSLEYALQTNGTVLDEAWVPLLRKYPVLVGLSIDGGKELHDTYRKSGHNGGSYKRVIKAKQLLDSHHIPYNILVTLTNQAAEHPQKLWHFLLKEHIDFVQFTPCLDRLETDDRSEYALEPRRFYRFYSTLYPLWSGWLRDGKYISIKLFDDLFNYFGKGIPTVCGIHGSCGVQFVCEGDGSVFPCDFYMLDEYRIGSLAEQRPSELRNKKIQFLDDGRDYLNSEPCKSCRYTSSCHGGCKRMVNTMYFSDGICWYAKLLDEILPSLLTIGRRLSEN